MFAVHHCAGFLQSLLHSRGRAWLFIINGWSLWGKAKSSCSLPGCSRRCLEGEGNVLVRLCDIQWKRESEEKTGSSNLPRRIAKDFSVQKKYITGQSSWGNQCYPFAVSRDTPLLYSEKPHTAHYNPLEFLSILQTAVRQNASQNTEPEAICMAASQHILHCHHAKSKRLKCKDDRCHFTTRYLQRTLSDRKRWYSFLQWLDLGINNVVLLQPHLIPLLGCQSQSAVFELRADGQANIEGRVQVLA